MAAGFIVLVVGATLVITLKSVSDQIATGSLTPLGSVLAGYVTRTYLATYRETLQQLNYYFQQPLDTSYLLAAERVTEQLPKDSESHERAKQLEKIIDKLLSRPFGSLGVSRAGMDPSEVKARSSDRGLSAISEMQGAAK